MISLGIHMLLLIEFIIIKEFNDNPLNFSGSSEWLANAQLSSRAINWVQLARSSHIWPEKSFNRALNEPILEPGLSLKSGSNKNSGRA